MRLGKLSRCEVAQRTMRTNVLYSIRYCSTMCGASRPCANRCRFRHSARNLPLKLSMNGFSQGGLIPV